MNDHRNGGHEAQVLNAYDSTDDSTSEISRKLRALYDSVQGEEVPDRFLDLLEQLDQIEAASGEETRR